MCSVRDVVNLEGLGSKGGISLQDEVQLQVERKNEGLRFEGSSPRV